MKKIHGIIYAMLSSAAFGIMPVFAKISSNNGTNTLTLLSFRYLLAAIILFIYFLIKKFDFKVSKKQLIFLALIGILGYTPTALTMFFSYNYIPVGLSTTLHFTYPAVVIVFNFFLYKEVFSRHKISALVLSMVGVYILTGMNSSQINLFGAILAITSGFTYGGCVMGMNHPEIKKIDNITLVFYFSLFAGASIFIFTIISKQLIFDVNLYTITSVVGISVISTIISIFLFVKALKIIGPSSTSILGTFEPIVSIALGILLFSEAMSFSIAIGIMLILFSVIVLAYEKKSVGVPLEK